MNGIEFAVGIVLFIIGLCLVVYGVIRNNDGDPSAKKYFWGFLPLFIGVGLFSHANM